MLGFDVINNWDSELKEINNGKIGEQPFHYPNAFLVLLGHAKACFHLPYRQTKEGIAQAHAKGKVPSIPIYNYMQKRINKSNIQINTDKDKDSDEYIIIAIDSTGIKVTNRVHGGEKWYIKNNNKKEYLKIHVVENVKTKKILAMMKVTDDEHVHDSNVLPELVDGVMNS